MAAENFKVKKGLEVGTGATITSEGVNVTGIITATQFKGDGSGLTGVVGSGSGVVVKDEGSAVGTAGTINFVGTGVAATLSAGTATVTVNAGGLDNVVEDTTPELGGNLNLNSKFVTGSGGINVTGVVTATTLKGNGDFVDIDVDGHTELDNTNIVGIVTVTNVSSGIGLKLIDASNKQFFAGGGGGGTPFVGSFTGHDFRIQVGGLQNAIFKYSAGATGNLELGPSSGIGITFNGASGNANYAGIITATGANITGIATFTGGVAKLLFDGNQKLITTINGIEVPDLNVTGVGTVGRLDTSGVTLGTNSTTFAAKFADNARAIFGGATQGDFGIYHDTNHSYLQRIPGGTGDIYMMLGGDNAIIAKTDNSVELYWDDAKKLETDNAGVKITGVCTATSFSGDGSALTGVTASGSGVVVKHDGSTVGTAGTINFSTNLDVSAISAGIVTVTASSGGATDKIEEGNTKIEITDTGTGSISFEIDGSEKLNMGSYTQFNQTVYVNDTVQVGGQLQVSDAILHMGNSGTRIRFPENDNITLRVNNNDIMVVREPGVNVTGILTATSFSGSGIGLTALPAAQLTGTLPAVSGANLTSLNADNLGSGEIPSGRFPATLPAASGANLTSLTAGNISGTIASGQIADEAVTFAKMQHVGTGVFIGRNDSGSGDIETLTAAEARTLLNVADGATAGITTAPSNIVATWNVVNQSTSAYRFTGPGQDPTANNPDIYLVRGNKYRFALNAGGHPFQIRVSNGGSAYNDGVTNNGAQTGNIEFYVQNDAPASLVYQCTSHGGMVGNIYMTGHQLTGADDQDNLKVTVNNNTEFAVHQDDTDGEVSLRAQDPSGSNNAKYMTFFTHPSGSAAAERARIHSNGQLELKVPDANPALKITPSGTNAPAAIDFNTPGIGPAIFKVQGSEKLRIDSSGHLKLPNDAYIRLGDAQTSSGTLRIYSNGTQSYISPGVTGNHIRFLNSGSTSQVELYFGTAQKLSTQSYGILVQGQVSGTSALSTNDAGEITIGTRARISAASGTCFVLENSNSGGDERLRITSGGNILKGLTSPRAQFFHSVVNPIVQIEGAGDFDRQVSITSSSSTASWGAVQILAHQRSNSIGGNTSLQAGDSIGLLSYQGHDGTNFIEGSRIESVVETGVGGNDMPSALVFSTNSGTTTLTERLRISSSGHITAPHNVTFSANGGPSDITNNVIIFGTSLFQRGGTNYSTSTGVFTAPVDGIYHFMCNPYRYQDSNDSALLLETSTNGGTTWTTQIEIRNMNNYNPGSGADSGRGWFTLSLSQLMGLNANDQVRVKAVGRVHCNGTFSRFSGFLVA